MNTFRITSVVLCTLVLGCARGTAEVPQDLREAISAANSAFVKATRSLDPAVLRDHFSGDILASLTKTVQTAKQRGLYAESVLNRIEWVSSHVTTQTAEVTTIENWSHRHFHVGTGQCAFEVPGRDVKQTYVLERAQGHWVIVKIIDDPANEPSRAVRCSGGAS